MAWPQPDQDGPLGGYIASNRFSDLRPAAGFVAFRDNRALALALLLLRAIQAPTARIPHSIARWVFPETLFDWCFNRGEIFLRYLVHRPV